MIAIIVAQMAAAGIAPLCVREVVARIGSDPLRARTSGSCSIWTGVQGSDRGEALPPESSSVEQVSREVGVGAATLERWRADALASGSGDRDWRQSALDGGGSTAGVDHHSWDG